MKNDFNRRGSALLIVLGFLSFMVVSAVAFSVFMREERVPSSALRSSVTTRHLVKAAMARAISRLDVAVGSDGFPGSTDAGSTYFLSPYGAGNLMLNNWYGRVFFPPNPEVQEAKTKDGLSQDMTAAEHAMFACPEETTPVLNLEALGYVPPMLINDVRFHSRRSWAAKWDYFDFDVGRYAFCAVNVSDFVDINRVFANTNRSSASRVSIAHLFSSPDQFDNFAHGGTAASYPLVSMMDYNLKMGNGFGDFISPFYRMISGGDNNINSSTAADTLKVRNQFFITDSWFPREGVLVPSAAGATGETTLYLDEVNESSKQFGQPFRSSLLRNSENQTLGNVAGATSSMLFWTKVMAQSPGLGQSDCFSLFDYLDRDDLPLSVAIPCCERVPMVAGVQPDVQLKFECTPSTTQSTGEGNSKVSITDYKLQPSGLLQGGVNLLVAFPFKRSTELDQSFKIQAMVRVIIAKDGFDTLRGLDAIRPLKEEWKANPDQFCFKRGGSNILVFNACSNEESISPSNFGDIESGGANVVIRKPLILAQPNINADTVLTKETTQKMKMVDGVMAPDGSPTERWKFSLAPLDESGNAAVGLDWMDDAAFTPYKTMPFKAYVCAWVKISKGDDLVDLVPAIINDDVDYGGPNNNVASAMYGSSVTSPTASPMLKCKSNGEFTFGTWTTPTPFNANSGDWVPKSYVAIDPRFNWAPEDYVVSNDNLTESTWWNIVKTFLEGDGRDPDPFMFVSNEGYLQSMGELAFLPRLSANFDTSDTLMSNCHANFDGVPRTDPERTANAVCAYRSYRTFTTGGLGPDSIFRDYAANGQYKILDSSRGIKINPFSDLQSVRLLPFTNTPYDWWVAGTNTTSGGGVNGADVSTKNKIIRDAKESLKFAFNSDSGADKHASRIKVSKKEEKGEPFTENDDDRMKIANVITTVIRSAPSSWLTAYDALDWAGDNEVDPQNPNSFRNFLGKQLDGSSDYVHSVDRKFLHAYWRSCFGNRQQLFLVFVRAESTALGGSGAGQTPSQLGGRAVALVWRDPSTPTGSTEFIQNNTWVGQSRRPHRTRVLFYHQFD